MPSVSMSHAIQHTNNTRQSIFATVRRVLVEHVQSECMSLLALIAVTKHVRQFSIIVASATSRVHPHVLGVFNARYCCSVRFNLDAICESQSRRSSWRLEQRGLEESNLSSRESSLRRPQCITLKMHLCPYWATLVVIVRGHINPTLTSRRQLPG